MGNWSDYILKLFQSTLPRRERQNADQEIEAFEKISIHTPTKGATYLSSKLESIWAISIHTPTKGATDFDLISPRNRHISIHTPTKGAT